MPKLVRVSVLLALIFSSAASYAAYELVQAPLADDPMNTHIYRLENGLVVYLSENHEKPRFYAEIAVRAGSVQDPAESTGLAHYLEHLLFKGTETLGTLDFAAEKPHLDRIAELYQQHFYETDPEKRAALYAEINKESAAAAQFAVPNEFDRIYQSLGGEDVNAHTWHEETVYKVSLPSNRIAQWAMMESERFRAPVFRLFQTELETVYEEMNRALDNKQRIIMEAVAEVLFKNHPYGQQTTLGKPEQLKNPSLKNIDEYYRSWYVPNNMGIFISGDIDIESTIRLIDEHFSGWERRETPERQKWEEAPLNGREYVERTYQGEEYVMLAFRTVEQNHPDAEALMLFDMILSNATAGLIDLNLNQQQRVRQAGSFPMMNNDYGAQYFVGVPKEGQTLEEVEQLLLEQVALVKAGDFEDWIVPAIINDFKKTEKAALESDHARVDKMRDSWIAFQEWEYRLNRIPRMEKVSKEDIVRVANEYFGANYVAGYRKDAPHKVPEIVKPELAKFEIDPSRQSAFGARILSLEVPPIEPSYISEEDYRKTANKKGVTLFHVENPINDIFTLTFSIEFGRHQDNTIGPAVDLLNKAGTEKLSAEDLKKEWYKLGTDFGIGAGDNETSITLTGLDENFEESVALLMDLMRNPRTDEATLQELKGIILVSRQDEMKQADSIASALTQYNRYGQESFYLRRMPSEAIKALTVEQLFGVTKQLLEYKHTVQYTGTIPMRRVQRILKKYHPIEEALQDPPPYKYLKVREVAENEIYLFDKAQNQSTVRIEFGGMDYTAESTPAIQYFNEYFSGGMAGIVFQELREARALAYVAASHYIQGYRADDQNLMIGFIQTQTDKTVDALAAFIELIDNMPESNERFTSAREAILSNYRTGKVDFRSIISTVRGWERRGLEPDPRMQWFEAVQSADMSTLKGFYEAEIDNHPKIISIVGEKARIDLEQLGTLGKVREIGLSEIFVE